MLQNLSNKKFAFIDIETTGTSAYFGKIIEIGILVVENGKIIKTYNSLINPETHVSPFIGKLTGIDIKKLDLAPTFADISEEINNLLKDAIFVAHNARFDYGFIKNEFKRIGKNFKATCLCTVRLSRKMYPRYKSHDLSSIVKRMNLTVKNRHRAFDDAKALLDFMVAIESEGRGKELETKIKELLKKSTYPQFLDERTVSNLPESPGVYFFYDSDGNVIYIGKSVNIKERVLSHFSSDHINTKEMRMCEQTKRVDFRQTVGELGALLLESELIKELNPIYNRQLRKTKSLVLATQVVIGGYKSVKLERSKNFDIEQINNTLGLFRSVSQGKEFLVKICNEYMLCPKIFGLEKTKFACFSYQLIKCSGACVGKISTANYNMHFDQAFAKRKIQSWIYNGAIQIEENNGEEKEIFIIDNWCLLSRHSSKEEYAVSINNHVFNYDVYKIISKYLNNPRNSIRIKPLAPNNISAYSNDERLALID